MAALAVWRPSSSDDAAALAGESVSSAPLPQSPSQPTAPVAAQRAPAAEARRNPAQDADGDTADGSFAAPTALADRQGERRPTSLQTDVGRQAGSTESSPRAALAPPERARLAKLAVDALAAGDRRSAAAHYQELARLSPDDPAFVAAARILARRMAGSR